MRTDSDEPGKGVYDFSHFYDPVIQAEVDKTKTLGVTGNFPAT